MEITHKIKLDAPTPNGWILPRRCGEIIMGQTIGKYVYTEIDMDVVRSLAIDISKVCGVIQSAEIEDDELILTAEIFEKSEVGVYMKYWATRAAMGDTSGGEISPTIHVLCNVDTETKQVQEDQLIFLGLQILGIK